MAAMAPAMAALGNDELLSVNLDVPKLYTRIRGLLPKLDELRGELDRLPDFDTSLIDTLDVTSRALAHCHALCLAAHEPLSALEELYATACEWRRTLLSDARALEHRGLLTPGCLERLRRRRGYRNVAFDLAALCTLLRNNWPAIENRSASSIAELEHAEVIAERLLTAVGRHERGPTVRRAASEMRRRAFSLVIRTYDQLRRGILYVRWHEGDADAIMPSLYAQRRRKRATGSRRRSGPPAPVHAAAAQSERLHRPNCPRNCVAGTVRSYWVEEIVGRRCPRTAQTSS